MAKKGTRQPIERAALEKTSSKQPRFTESSGGAFGSWLDWLTIAEIESLPYMADSRRRDAWLRSFWKIEPHLAGVVNAVSLIDSNRGWEVVGGRNQVRRYTDILHDAEDGAGWRTLMRKTSLSYWTTDLGAVNEIGRDGKNGPLRGLFHVDSARCKLTGKRETPIAYFPQSGGGGMQMWTPADFIHVNSMPSDDEAFHGLGFCAVSRALEIVRLLYAVMCHDQEQVAARAPKGILFLHNVSEDQWNQSLEARSEKLDSMERRYYGGVQVIAASGAEEPGAVLVALSQLPANFDAKVFTEQAMYAVALCFGYDPSEFWPVQFGSLGRGTETEVQHQKASGKGGTEFALAYQERLQTELPPTLHFEFEQRDDSGELMAAGVEMAKIGVVTALYNAGLPQGAPLITREQALSMLAEKGLIPNEWTVVDEEVEATDTEDADLDSEMPEELEPDAEDEEPPEEEQPPAERWLELERVQRAMSTWPDQEIVRYTWPAGTSQVLWRPHRSRFHVMPRVTRADGGVLYKGQGVTITQEDVDTAIAEAKRRVSPEFAALLEAPVLTPEQVAAFGVKG